MISGVEISNIVNTNSMRFAGIFKNRKNVTKGIVSKPKSFQPSKSCYSSSMDFKGSDLSLFPLKEPIGCLMSVAVYTSTIEIPQLQPQHHYMVSLRDWIETKNIIGECERILNSIPLFPKSPNLPLSSKYFLLRMTRLHIHIKTPKLSKTMMAQQPFLKS